MKQETKEAIDWFINKSVYATSPALTVEEYKQFEILKEILSNLEELEKQLQHGGFIKDYHGNICKDGDRIRIIKDSKTYEIKTGEYNLKWFDNSFWLTRNDEYWLFDSDVNYEKIS